MKLSVIVPAYNEEKYLAATLGHIRAAADALQDFELIVVDNASTDKTPEIARSFAARIAHETEHNIGAVRNTGARTSVGDVLVFVDADTHVRPGLFEKIVEALSDPACLGGAVEVRYSDGMPLFTEYYVRLCLWLGRHMALRNGAAQYCRRETFFELGGYDTTIYVGEDIDFQRRLDRLARIRGSRTTLIGDPPVLTSSRRFVRFGFLKTVFFTHPATIFLAWRRRGLWRSWYEKPVR